MRKINVPVIGAGFVFGLVLQLNWAQEYLVNQGLFFCIGKYGPRMLISALAFAFVFMLISLLSGQKYRVNRRTGIGGEVCHIVVRCSVVPSLIIGPHVRRRRPLTAEPLRPIRSAWIEIVIRGRKAGRQNQEH